VQNHIEEAGVATVSMTVQPHITAMVGAPRAVFLRYPAGNQVGEAGKPQQQQTILRAALDAAVAMQTTGTIVELPYRWRRFPVEETPVYTGHSDGARHPQAEAMGEALDTVVRLARDYQSWVQARAAQEASGALPRPEVAQALLAHAERVAQFIAILDTAALDQLREIVNRVTTLELRVSGKFV